MRFSMEFVLFLFIYFIPTLLALGSKKDNFFAIMLLNLLLGWTLIGWFVALIWAATKDKK